MSSRTALGSLTTSRPKTSTRPASGLSSVVKTRTSVVLPAPLGPRRPNTVPSSIPTDTPARATVTPKRLTTPSVRTAGASVVWAAIRMDAKGTRRSRDPGPAVGRTAAIGGPGTVESMRIATWNVNSVKQRVPRLLPWLDERRPDVVCLQETKLADDAFRDLLADELGDRGYAAAVNGEATWNGVAILSRVG